MDGLPVVYGQYDNFNRDEESIVRPFYERYTSRSVDGVEEFLRPSPRQKGVTEIMVSVYTTEIMVESTLLIDKTQVSTRVGVVWFVREWESRVST